MWRFWSDGLRGGVGVILGLKGSFGHLQPLSLLSSSLLPRKPKELLDADCWRGYWDFGKVWSISSRPNIGRYYCLIELPRSVKGLGCFLPITMSQWMIYLVDDIKGWFHTLYVIADRGVEGCVWSSWSLSLVTPVSLANQVRLASPKRFSLPQHYFVSFCQK